MGAGKHHDGANALIFPSSASNVPVEMFEVATPLLMHEKEYITDSGGAGRQRGGLGVRVSYSRLPGWDLPVITNFMAHRMRVPPFGLMGGGPATPSRLLLNHRELTREEFLTQSEGLTLTDDKTVCTTELGGGGGVGPPTERPIGKVVEDVRNGLVSPASAEADYGIVLNPVTLEVTETQR
jgi:N-methylhydantoinase B/oxoprolinase/acetone carboxylase alpha subunit